MGSYRQLRWSEREEISRGFAQGHSRRQIAAQLGRAVSTVARDCRRQGQPPSGYRAWEAQAAAGRARRRPRRPSKLQASPGLRAYVVTKLARRWSPEQIAKRLPQDYPEDTTMRLSHETIYQYLYILGRGALKQELVRTLRQARPYRQRRWLTQDDRRGKIPDMLSIEERPPAVAERSVPGHWEGDLLMGGTRSRSALGVLVERQTRFLLLVPLQAKTAAAVREAFAAAIRRLPAALRQSLTYDQGTEMYQHQRFTMATSMTVYFCHPHSPWERGTCENTNGLLRQYFPKGIDFRRVPMAAIHEAETQMNGRPRKVLAFRTPTEVFSEVLG